MRSARPPQDRKFGCPKCEKKFFTPKDLRRHENTHLGIRDHVCLSCHTRFGRKDHLTRHAKKSCSVLRGHNATKTHLQHNHQHQHQPQQAQQTQPQPQHLLLHQRPPQLPQRTVLPQVSPLQPQPQPQPQQQLPQQLQLNQQQQLPQQLQQEQHYQSTQPFSALLPTATHQDNYSFPEDQHQSLARVCFYHSHPDAYETQAPDTIDHYTSERRYEGPAMELAPARSLPGSQRQSPTSSSSLYESSASCYQQSHQRVADLHSSNYQQYQATGDFYNVL